MAIDTDTQQQAAASPPMLVFGDFCVRSQMTRLVATGLFTIHALFGAAAWAQYAEDPFKVQVIEPARALVEMVGINNWLGANYASITNQQAQGAREHLHALIDARVKESFAQHNALRSPQPDRQLAVLYSWAGRLGVYGADLVYAAVKGDYPVSPPPGPKAPNSITISLQGESLVLQSNSPGWRVAVPFHFFPFAVGENAAPGGHRTQAIAVSTGTAADSAPPGYSQATMALISVQGAIPGEFEQEWLRRFQVPPETPALPVGSVRHRSRITYDPVTRLHKEVVFVSTEKAAFAILYSGLEGTYQANRPHFVDVLRTARFE